MAEQVLARCGLHLDELNRLRIIEPKAAQLNDDLKTESTRFLESIGNFDKFIEVVTSGIESLGKQVEREKLNAISSRNALRFISRQKEAEAEQLKIMMYEKLTELERLRREEEKLRVLEDEQKDYLQKFM